MRVQQQRQQDEGVRQRQDGEGFEMMCPIRILLGKKAGHIFSALDTCLGGCFSLDAIANMDVRCERCFFELANSAFVGRVHVV